MRKLAWFLITLMLASCATPSTYQSSINAERTSPHRYAPINNAEHMASSGIVATDVEPPLPVAPLTPSAASPTTPPAQDGVSGWDVLGAIVLLPLVIPLVLLAGYGNSRSYHGTSTCKSKFYADGTKLITTCY